MAKSAATTKELVDFLFERGLQHLASSVAHNHLEHIIWCRDWCGWRQNLIRFRHGVTLLNIDPGDQVGCLNTGRLRRFSHPPERASPAISTRSDISSVGQALGLSRLEDLVQRARRVG